MLAFYDAMSSVTEFSDTTVDDDKNPIRPGKGRVLGWTDICEQETFTFTVPSAEGGAPQVKTVSKVGPFFNLLTLFILFNSAKHSVNHWTLLTKVTTDSVIMSTLEQPTWLSSPVMQTLLPRSC